ncbi:MAG TPA: 50S ribosomal protein L33 [Candidatus Omnitrophota bacterium]|nr:50S ribosomal protein L33 [Candidatus Omnitrophota bacterium]HPD83980.1 50S ribosomal protein L33 [Candidatus Omnitrophota bacterium]HRZ02837.1 50S ribosomal protein L33 [Candidatus Omnitrophota bacterium]
MVREHTRFECAECRRINYDGTKDWKKHPERLELKKYCAFCQKHTVHKEQKK